VLTCCIIDLEQNTVCFLTVTNTDLDITMYERESQATISRKLINEPTYAFAYLCFAQRLFLLNILE